jgi:hypothetical protein
VAESVRPLEKISSRAIGGRPGWRGKKGLIMEKPPPAPATREQSTAAAPVPRPHSAVAEVRPRHAEERD